MDKAGSAISGARAVCGASVVKVRSTLCRERGGARKGRAKRNPSTPNPKS